MKKLCVLITMNYPYNDGETFIENEISYLASSFDQVFILSLSVRKNSNMTRVIPDNVIAVPLAISSSRIRYIKYAFKGIAVANKTDWIEISSLKGIYAKGAALYAIGRCYSSFKKSTKILDSIVDWVEYEYCIFYSYWFLDQALLANRLKFHYSNNLRTKSISRAHGYDLYDNRNKAGIIPFRKLCLSQINGVYTCSQDGELYLHEKYPEYINKIQTEYLGTKDFGVQKIRNKKDGFHIVSCSSIIPLKNVGLIAEALGILAKRDLRNIHWTCIGDGPLFVSLEKQVEVLGIIDQVVFKKQLTNQQVIKYYQNSWVDLFVNVSDFEGLPVSLMEAQSFGIPCIATDVGGTREIINSNVGWLLPRNITKTMLAEAIFKISMLDSLEVEKKRIESRKNWQLKFSSEKNFKKWSEILQNPIEKR